MDVPMWAQEAVEPAWQDARELHTSNEEPAGETATTITGQVFGALEDAKATRSKSSQVRRLSQALADLGHREHWLIPAEDIIREPSATPLGRGGFGSVYAGCLHGASVALKYPHGVDDFVISAGTVALTNELRILRHVRHPNIVMWHGACIDPDQILFVLVFEKIDGEPLHAWLEEQKLDEHVNGKFWVLENIACALRYLHVQSPNILHGDIKDSNIMVERLERRPRARLLDFGLSRIIKENSSLLGASWRWAAPEVLLNTSRLSPASDVFSFGRLFHRVLSGQRPLFGIKHATSARLFAAHSLVWMPAWGGAKWNHVRSLCHQCIAFEKEARPPMTDVHQEVRMLLEQAHITHKPIHPLGISGCEHNCQQLSFTFDLDEEGLPIIDCSTAFKMLIGAECMGLDLLEVACDPTLVTLLVQLELQLCAKPDTRSEVMQTELKFCFPTRGGSPLEVRAICSRNPRLSEIPFMTFSMQDVQMSAPMSS